MSNQTAKNARYRITAGAFALSLLATPSLALVANATTVVAPKQHVEQTTDPLFTVSKIGFNTIVVEDPELLADTEVVESEGSDGVKHVYSMPVFGKGGASLQREVVITEPVDRVIRRGTAVELPVAEEPPAPVVEEAPAEEAASRGTSGDNVEETPVYADVATSGEYSLGDLQFMGVINWGGYKFTYYSQSVLPGGGLAIPGRHVNAGGFVSDGDGYIVLAGSAPMGTVYATPFGYSGKIYDRGTSGNHLDVYTQ